MVVIVSSHFFLPVILKVLLTESPVLQLVEVLGWCLDLGIRCVSVYAFSTENFKRSREEVEALMRLAEAKYKEMLKVRKRNKLEYPCCTWNFVICGQYQISLHLWGSPSW